MGRCAGWDVEGLGFAEVDAVAGVGRAAARRSAVGEKMLYVVQASPMASQVATVQTPEPELLPRPRACGPGAGLAGGQPGLCATGPACVTRGLLGAAR